MDHLPPYLPVQAALILIATRIPAACLELFEASETLPRSPFATEEDKVAVWVPVPNFDLTAVSVIIAKYLHPGDRTIRDKWGTFELLDDGWVRPKGKGTLRPSIMNMPRPSGN